MGNKQNKSDPIEEKFNECIENCYCAYLKNKIFRKIILDLNDKYPDIRLIEDEEMKHLLIESTKTQDSLLIEGEDFIRDSTTPHFLVEECRRKNVSFLKDIVGHDVRVELSKIPFQYFYQRNWSSLKTDKEVFDTYSAEDKIVWNICPTHKEFKKLCKNIIPKTHSGVSVILREPIMMLNVK